MSTHLHGSRQQHRRGQVSPCRHTPCRKGGGGRAGGGGGSLGGYRDGSPAQRDKVRYVDLTGV